MTHEIIHTERTMLKALTPAHIHELFNTLKKEDVIRFLGCPEAMFDRYESMHKNGMETNRISHFFFLIHDKQTNLPIGECGFHTWNRTHRRAELFYALHNDVDKNKGIMREVLQAVLRYGYTNLDIHRIEAKVANWNTPSVKLVQRFGFTKEGVAREDYYVNGNNQDSDCYSLLKWEWESKTDQ
jgi:ribosomal-protein-alanine N-acetyltransferase